MFSTGPGRHILPVRVILGFKLSAAAVDVAASHRREGMNQKTALHRIGMIDEARHILENFARLLVGPEGAVGWKLHKILRAGIQTVTGIAAGVARPSRFEYQIGRAHV